MLWVPLLTSLRQVLSIRTPSDPHPRNLRLSVMQEALYSPVLQACGTKKTGNILSS